LPKLEARIDFRLSKRRKELACVSCQSIQG